MMDILGGSSSRKFMPKSQVKKLKHKMQKSFQKGDQIAKREKIIKAREQEEADKMLEERLNDLTQ